MKEISLSSQVSFISCRLVSALYISLYNGISLAVLDQE